MVFNFNEEQKRFLRSSDIDPERDFSQEEVEKLRDKVANLLQLCGYTDDWELNDIGDICEDILWILDSASNEK